MEGDLEARPVGSRESPRWISAVAEIFSLSVVAIYFLPRLFHSISNLFSTQSDDSATDETGPGALTAFWSKYPIAFPIVLFVIVLGLIRLLTFRAKIASLLGAAARAIKPLFARAQKKRVPSVVVFSLLLFSVENTITITAFSIGAVILGAIWAPITATRFIVSTFLALLIDFGALFVESPIISIILLSSFGLGAHWLIATGFKVRFFQTVSVRIFRTVVSPLAQLLTAQVEIRKSLLYLLIYISFPIIIGRVWSGATSILFSVASLSWTSLTALSILLFFIVKRVFGSSSADVSSKVVADDVSRLSATEVDRIFYVRTAHDIKNIIMQAREQGKSVSVRGQSHTMGGHTIATGGFVIDTKFLNRIRYDESRSAAIVEPGATWADLIKYLNPLGLAPEIMQSYCSFSVGGTIAVNAHGITSDFGMVESVLSLRLINADGQEVYCDRSENAELFKCVIGGFGLFGVVYEVTLRVVKNVKIGMEMIKVPKSQFDSFYSKVLRDPSVEVKIARIEITSMDEIFLFLYRRTSDSATISDLSDAPREMSTTSQLLYKWVLPLRAVQALRFAVETYTQTPMDWAGEHDRNLLLYESARPLAMLYEPLFRLNQTFVLQEYFVPHANFEKWMDAVREIILARHESMTLLNITIRYLYKDNETVLPYAKEDMFAFVLYWRISCNAATDQRLGEIHRRLIDHTLNLGGTFYLPYRRLYTDEQLHKSYPEIQQFFKLKLKYDPNEVFSNLWYQRYSPSSSSPESRRQLASSSSLVTRPMPSKDIPIVSQTRTNSYKTLLATEDGRRKLRHFLLYVFNIENERSLYAKILRATLRPENKTDLEIYAELQRVLSKRSIPLGSTLIRGIKQLKQLREQKKEFTDEVISIVSAAGYGGKIHDYVSIGDSGKLVRSLQHALGMKGQMWVLHDMERPADVIERGSLFSVGKFIKVDYDNISDVPIRSNSVDLVTINMGLHHIPQEQLPIALQIIHRILRPGGLFLVREHDAEPDLIPMLDIAHSVFNVVTGVPLEEERTEIRAFRPVDEWRRIVSAHGFEDMQLYGLQATDPTIDYMICFAKPPIRKSGGAVAESRSLRNSLSSSSSSSVGRTRHNGVQTSAGSTYRLSEWLLVRLAEQYGAFLNHTPWFRFPYISFIWMSWKIFFNEFSIVLSAHGISEAFGNYGFMMNATILPVVSMLFLQLAVLSVPLMMLYGAENPPDEIEELSVEVSGEHPVDWRQSVDPRIVVISSSRQADRGVFSYEIDVPRHVPFTEILKKISSIVPSAVLCSVSRQSDVSVEVILSSHEDIAWLRDQSGCELNYTFEYPSDRSLHAALTVQTLSLFAFIRHCEAKGIRVAQVFDFLE